VHDSQVALPLATMSAQRVTNLYDLMDAAYDTEIIREPQPLTRSSTAYRLQQSRMQSANLLRMKRNDIRTKVVWKEFMVG